MKNDDLRNEAIAIGTRAIALSLVAVFLIYLTFSMSPATATLGLTEQNTKTFGATTITWDSSFHDMDYTLGDPITMIVTWTVHPGGTAAYDVTHPFDLKGPKFTPKGRDPAEGVVSSISQSGTTVTVTFSFTGLHLDRKRNVEIGNAHFKLYLMVDEDGDGTAELLTGYGVNIHVEDPV